MISCESLPILEFRMLLILEIEIRLGVIEGFNQTEEMVMVIWAQH